MDPVTVQIASAVGIAIVALVAGVFIGRTTGRARKASDLADELEKTKEEFETYRGEVVQQFADTAGKFRRLNETYGDLHKQLATSAAVLCADRADDILLALPDASVSNSEASDMAGEVIDAADETTVDLGAETAVTTPISDADATEAGAELAADVELPTETIPEAGIADVDVQLDGAGVDELTKELEHAAAEERNRTAHQLKPGS